MRFLFSKKDKPLFTESNNECINPDAPMFGNDESVSEDLNLRMLEAKGEQERKNKSLSYSFNILKFLIIIVLVLVFFDGIESQLNIENNLLNEAFELVKYSTTTVMGYLFARKEQ